ncbi:TPA: hypothetical protein JG871_003927 [Enterobacter hormaechei subsp. xiangfangensis]|nr:hypothetical protein [Enterobacter hormaechei subsp. xiangfangensis]
MNKAILITLTALLLAGCAKQTPAEFGRELGKEYVLKDDQAVCNAAGFYYWREQGDPRPGVRQEAAGVMDILKRELVARNLKSDATCEMSMKNGAAEAKRLNAEAMEAQRRQTEQEQRKARAASY